METMLRRGLRGNSEEIGFLMHHPENPLGAHEIAQNQRFLRTYLSATVGIDFENENIEEIVKDFAAMSGQYSEMRMENILGGCYLLHHYLPKLKQLALDLGHINYEMLRTIWMGLVAAPCLGQPSALWDRIDNFLVNQLSPSKPRQALPTWQHIRQALRDELVRLGLYEDLEAQDAEVDRIIEPNFGVELLKSTQPGASTIMVTLPSDAAYMVKENLEVAAKNHGIRQDEVITSQLCGNGTTTLNHTVHIFGICELEPDQDVELVYAQGIGRLTKTQQQRLSQQYRYHNAMSIAAISRDVHDPTPAQRMLVMLRDGTCRFPGCHIDARYCDIDHIVNHEQGGWTTLSNLQSLCRHHHNYKTDRHARAAADEYGAITWEFNTGRIVTTLPTGPLAGKITGTPEGITTRHNKATEPEEYSLRPPKYDGFGRWGTTLSKRRKKQRERHLQRNGVPLTAGDKYEDWLPIPSAPPEE